MLHTDDKAVTKGLPRIQLTCDHSPLAPFASACAERLQQTVNATEAHADYELYFGADGVALRAMDNRHGAIMVDFTSGKNAHRRKFGGGKGQLIAKACGLKSARQPHILDATAGLGQDAFALASLGARVTLLERSPVVWALLADGLARAQRAAEMDIELAAILANMHLLAADSVHHLQQAQAPAADVIYLDPMFPEKTKSAAVNKAMQAFHALLGGDLDEAELLAAALTKAKHRVVVKRPRLAATIAGPAPSYSLAGKSSRFDVYALTAFD